MTATSLNAQPTAPPKTLPRESILARARGVFDIEIEALEGLKTDLNASFIAAVELLEACPGRVIVTGMGKSGLIGKKIAATMASTGTPALFLHPAEGSHGDLGVVMKNDVVIALSNSGETAEILNILPTLKRLNVPLISITGHAQSTLAQRSDVALTFTIRQEACPLNLAPTASTTATLVLGDALAVVLLERKGFSPEDFALFHPSGTLGKKLLLTVADLMHTGDALPLVPLSTSFLDALMTMTGKKLGLALAVDASGKLVGILTDGDIRRILTQTPDVTGVVLGDVINPAPKTIEKTELALTALRLMEERKITSLVITTPDGHPEGVLHLHDILQTGIR